MEATEASLTPQDPFSSVRQRLEKWRSDRRPGKRIPKPVWRAVVEVARAQGINKTAKALRINHTTLKNQVKSAGRNASPQSKSNGAFIELPPIGYAAPPECVIKLEDAKGARLHVELTGKSVEQIEPILLSLWAKRR